MTKEIEIPEGYEAKIVGNKVVLELKESEDERIRKRLIVCLKLSLKGAEEQDAAGCSRQKDIEAYKWGIAYLEKQKKQKPADCSKEDEMHLNNAILAAEKEWGIESCTAKFLKSLRPQPKQEWSDKDNSMIQDIIEAIDTDYAVSDYNEMIDWLKSLRPSWKPSKEQMMAVYNAMTFATGNTLIYLNSLYEQLKVL